MQAINFPAKAELTITAQQSRGILNEMGINIPARIGKGDIDRLLKEVPKLTTEQISTYVEKARKLVGGK
jgi:hypothetical protein